MKASISAFILTCSLFISVTSSAQSRVMYQNPQTNPQANSQDAAALLASPPAAKAVVMLCSCARVDLGPSREYAYKLLVLVRNAQGQMQQFEMGEQSYLLCHQTIRENPACPKS